MVRKLKYHEQKLLRKVDFITYASDNNHRDAAVIRRYAIQKPSDYQKYNRIAGVRPETFLKPHQSPRPPALLTNAPQVPPPTRPQTRRPAPRGPHPRQARNPPPRQTLRPRHPTYDLQTLFRREWRHGIRFRPAAAASGHDATEDGRNGASCI
jgi:hypothetical protein